MKISLLYFVLATIAVCPQKTAAQVLNDGHGPDGWQVVDVASDDVLNVRMGPATAYPVVAAFAHDARAIQQETCVPLMTMEQFTAMSEAEIAALPARWCLVHSVDRAIRGWVRAEFLAEDGAEPAIETPAD